MIYKYLSLLGFLMFVCGYTVYRNLKKKWWDTKKTVTSDFFL